LPDTLHVYAVVLEKLTASPELAVALTMNGMSLYVWSTSAPKVIVWLAFWAVVDWLAVPPCSRCRPPGRRQAAGAVPLVSVTVVPLSTRPAPT
jgi:hypothetical protein